MLMGAIVLALWGKGLLFSLKRCFLKCIYSIKDYVWREFSFLAMSLSINTVKGLFLI